MSEHPATPRLTQHARNRCAEMQIPTSVAKDIVRDPDLVRPGHTLRDGQATIAISDRHPKYAVVYFDTEPPLIVTVVFRTYEQYERDGADFRVV